MTKDRSFTVFLGVVILIIYGLASCQYKDEPKTDYGEGDEYPAYSPDGRYIAYVHSGNTPHKGLYIIDRDGNNKRLVLAADDNRLMKPSYSFTSLSWSPDGQWLVFSNGHILKCKINGDSLKTLTDIDSTAYDGFYDPSWSNDNSRIVFAIAYKHIPNKKDGYGIYQTSVDFTHSKMLFNSDLIDIAGDPEFSPDATHLIFFSGNKDNYDADIYVSDSLGNARVKLTNNGRFNYEPTWSPDGQKIAWTSYGHINIMNADGTNQKEIAEGSGPSWSVNDEIVFSQTFRTGADKYHNYWREYLYVISPDGKNKKQITF